MTFSRSLFLTAVAVLATATAVAQERVTIDKVVAVVGNSAILYSDLERQGEENTRRRREEGYTSDRDPHCEALEQLLLQKLLATQAQIDSIFVPLDDVPSSVRSRVDQMIAEAGSVARLEAMHRKPIYDIESDMRLQIEEMRSAQAMRNDVIGKVKITPGEVERFYRTIDKDSLPIIPEQYVYAQIVKFPASTKEAKQRTRERLLEMRQRILDGMSFDMLARMYSVDVQTAIRGGEMGPVPLEGLDPNFAAALSKLKPDQVSEVVETEYGFHIIQLIDNKGNNYRFRHILLKPTFTDEELNETARLLDSVANLIRCDSITFEQAALEYSDDKYSRQNGGIVTNHEMLEMAGGYADASYTNTRFFKEDLDRDYPMIRRLEVGEVSDAYPSYTLRGDVMSKIIKIIEIIPSHRASLENDYLTLERIALQRKQEAEFLRWLDEKIETMYILIDPQFRRPDQFEVRGWLK